MPRPAGFGASVELPDCDFETRSPAGFHWDAARNKYTALPPATTGKKKGLPVVGAAVYAMHSDTDALSFTFDLKDSTGSELWIPGMPNPARAFEHVASGGLFEAWHASFEWYVWNYVMTRRYGWPAMPARQMRCAMAKARAFGLPGSLDLAGLVLGVDELKDEGGKKLLDKFSVPHTPTKKDPRHWHDVVDSPIEAAQLYAYNAQDIVAEAAVSAQVPDLEGLNLDYWFADQDINRRGVAIDAPLVRAATLIVQQAHGRYNAELPALTGGAVTKASEVERITGWLAGRGVHVDGLTEESVDAALQRDGLPLEARRVLEIRQAIGSASVKKLFAMSDRLAPTGRLHDLYAYHAARTGRPTGNGPQPMNLPKAGPSVFRCAGCGRHFGGRLTACAWCGQVRGPSKPLEWSPEAAEDAIEIIATGSLDALEFVFGDAMLTIAGCLRGVFVAAPGHVFISSDFTAIEAVVLAALAGVEWRLDVFRTHGKIYETAAARAFGVSLEEMLVWPAANNGQHHPLRQKGKIGELAYGFQGWIPSARAFGHPGTDDEIKTEILAWRAASSEIPELWGGQSRDWKPELFGIEGAVIEAIQNRGETFRPRLKSPTAAASALEFTVRGDALYVRLLSGRYLTYHRPRLEPSDRRRGEWSISYEGYNTNAKNGATGWIRMRSWGGRFVENFVQAIAHDLHRFSKLNHESAGYPIVLHSYDETVSEVREDDKAKTVEDFERLMMILPTWAAGWPVKVAGGWRGGRYRKA